MEELNLLDLATEQIEILGSKVEIAVRKYISSKVTSRSMERLSVVVEVEDSKILNLLIDVDFALAPRINDIDAEEVANEATKMAIGAAENYLRTLK